MDCGVYLDPQVDCNPLLWIERNQYENWYLPTAAHTDLLFVNRNFSVVRIGYVRGVITGKLDI